MCMAWINKILFPKYCRGCKIPNVYICSSCIKLLQPAELIPGPLYTAVFSYRNKLIRSVVRDLKYKNKKHVCNDLFPSLEQHISNTLAEHLAFPSNKIILLPVPISKKRKKSRGYNQAEIIAQGIASQNSTTFCVLNNILIRTKETLALHTHHKKERSRILRNAFTVLNPETIQNIPVIIIDDICTSGATFDAIREILKKHKIHPILFVALTH